MTDPTQIAAPPAGQTDTAPVTAATPPPPPSLGVQWLRREYPMYADKSDEDLVAAFKDKFYPDKSPEDFSAALEAKGAAEEPLVSNVGRVAGAVIQAAPKMAVGLAERLAQTPTFLGSLMEGGGTLAAPANLAADWAQDPAGTRRKMVDATLDMALLPLGGPISHGLAAASVAGVRPFAPMLLRGVVEGAGLGAIYEGVDATVAGESAKTVAERAWQGAKFGAVGGAVIGGITKGVSATITGLNARAAAEAATSSRAATQTPQDMESTLAQALEDSGIRHSPIDTSGLPPSEGTQGQLAPGQPQVAGLLPSARTAPVNELPSSGRTLITPPPGTGGTTEVPQGINVLPSSGETQTGTPPRIWGSDRQLPERSSIPPINELPPSGTVMQLPGIGMQRLSNAFPKVEWSDAPTSLRSSNTARAFPLGSTVYDAVGRPLTVRAYADDGSLGVESALENEAGKVGKVGFADVTAGQPNGLTARLNLVEQGARTRIALKTTTTNTPSDEVAVGLGKFGRVSDFGQQLNWTPAQQYQEWTNSMLKEFGQTITPKLKAMYGKVTVRYGTELTNLIVNDPRIEESINNKDWADVQQKLVELVGPVRAGRIAAALPAVQGDVTKALRRAASARNQ